MGGCYQTLGIGTGNSQTLSFVMAYESPLTRQQQKQVQQQTDDYIQKASELYRRSFAPIAIKFDLIGKAAGMYRYAKGQRHIRYNSFLFAKYFEENLRDTVPHEVAHYITDVLYSYRHVKAHGKEWRMIMSDFGVKPEVRCHFDMQGIPTRKLNYYTYRCDCRTHTLSSIRHNRIQRECTQYYCKFCKQILRKTVNV